MPMYADIIASMRESFAFGVSTKYGYAEVWKNPTRREIMDGVQTQTKVGGGRASAQYGERFRYFAGIITPTDWYAWDRDRATHSDVREELDMKFSDTKPMPVYCGYYHETNTLLLEMARWSAGPVMNNRNVDRNLVITQIIESNPNLKALNATTNPDVDFHWDT